jgi:sulfur-oxidizing protein SoxX
LTATARSGVSARKSGARAEHRVPAPCKAASALLLAGLAALSAAAAEPANVVSGRELAFATSKGNCLACHAIEGGRQMGDIGPPLVGIATRYPERRVLFDRIWDESAYNPVTLMPPFGRHGILSAHEINLIVDFLYTR